MPITINDCKYCETAEFIEVLQHQELTEFGEDVNTWAVVKCAACERVEYTDGEFGELSAIEQWNEANKEGICQ